MPKRMIILLFALTLLASTPPTNDPHPIVGKWLSSRISKNEKLELMANFRADQTYDGYINNKTFVTGKYWVRNDTIGISDATCNSAYFGTYKLTFRNDSLFVAGIRDTCQSRYQGTNGLAFVRIAVPKRN